jgi:hypothetical protein
MIFVPLEVANFDVILLSSWNELLSVKLNAIRTPASRELQKVIFEMIQHTHGHRKPMFILN